MWYEGVREESGVASARRGGARPTDRCLTNKLAHATETEKSSHLPTHE